MSEFWAEDLTPEQAEEMIENLADKIVRRRMEAPAIMFLHSHKPLANVLGHASIVFSPFIAPFVGWDRMNDYSRLLTTRRHWERLVEVIEYKAQAFKDESKSKEPSACNT